MMQVSSGLPVRTGAATALAILQIIGAAVVAILFGFLSLSFAIVSVHISPGMVFLTGAYISIACVLFAVRTLILTSQARRLAGLAKKSGGRIPFRAAVRELGLDPQKMKKNIGRIFSRRFITGAEIDLSRKELVLGHAWTPQEKAEDDEDDTVFIEKPLRSMTPLFIAVGALLICITFLNMHNPPELIAAATVTTGVFLVASVLLPKSTQLAEVPRPVARPKTVETGDADVNDQLNQAVDQLIELNRLTKRLSGSAISGHLDSIAKSAWEIVEHIRAHPEKVRRIRQFLNYYLPTTVRLIGEYDQFRRQQVRTENVSATITRIEQIMESIEKTFRDELDNLHLDQAIDISAEIEVMQNMLHQEGPDSIKIHMP